MWGGGGRRGGGGYSDSCLLHRLGLNFEFYYFCGVWGKSGFCVCVCVCGGGGGGGGIGHLQVLLGVTFKTDYFWGSLKILGISFLFVCFVL